MGEIKDLEGLSEFCGAMMGDGWIQNDERCLFLAGDPVDDRDYYDNHIIPLVSKMIVPVCPKEFTYWGVYGIGIYHKKIIRQLLKVGLMKGKKVANTHIPMWIMKSNKNVKIAFLRGVFDTDGGISMQKDYTKYADSFNANYHTKSRIRIVSISKKMIAGLSEILEFLNFRFVMRERKGGFKCNRNNSSSYYIEINSIKDVHRFFNEVKPNNYKHITKYLIWKKFGFCPPSTDINTRKDILKNRINPFNLYAEVAKWSNARDSN